MGMLQLLTGPNGLELFWGTGHKITIAVGMVFAFIFDMEAWDKDILAFAPGSCMLHLVLVPWS